MEEFYESQGFEQVIGTAGRDVLFGSASNSYFLGLQGRDVLVGGSGIDLFGYQALIDGPDIVQSFELDRDQIVLTELLEGINYLGEDAFADEVIQVRPYFGGSIVLVDPDGDSGDALARPFLLVQEVLADDLLANPDHFVLGREVIDLGVSAVLTEDTGVSSADGITSNARISGLVDQPDLVQQLLASFSDGSLVDITEQLRSDGTFALESNVLASLNGGTLADGNYTLELQAIATNGQPSDIFSLQFELDTTAPTITLELAPSADSAPVGDQQTTFETVSLIGQTEAGLVVSLLNLGDSTQANTSGEFTFDGIDLTLGSNAFSVSVTDLAGNQASTTTLFERIQPNQPPIVAPDKIISVDEDSGAALLNIAAPTDVDGDTLSITLLVQKTFLAASCSLMLRQWLLLRTQ